MIFSPNTPEFEALNHKYKKAFGENIPTMMIPDSETFEGLYEKVSECIKQNKDLLPDYYGWQEDEIY